MFKIKVKPPRAVDIVNKISKTVDDQFAADIQREVIDKEILELIAAGVSPVEIGPRRFEGYRHPDRYPGKRKEKRPVSLYLTGVMLSWYEAIKISGVRLRMGIHPSAPQDVKERAQANNEGVPEKNIVARRFIPLKGETYNISVMRKIKELYAKRIKALLSK